MSLTPSELFDAAYDVLARPEIALAQGKYGSELEGRFCAVGALRQVAFGTAGTPHYGPASHGGYQEAFRMLARSLPRQYASHIPSWNDEPGRTKEDVLALFRSLAAQVPHGG